MKGEIGLIGAGNMGKALVSGILSARLIDAQDLVVSDLNLSRLRQLKKQYKIQITPNNSEVLKKTSIIILAVKPQVIGGVLNEIGDKFTPAQTIISIAAGISTKHIEKFIPRKVAVVRVMPNTPALLKEGASAIAGGSYAKKKNIQSAQKIFQAVGKVFRVKEELMDAVTGLSGSGPAYIFFVMEALINGGVRLGLSRAVSEGLVQQTLLGAAKLALQDNPTTLRKKVTSPGGTTEAAIKYLQKQKFSQILSKAVEIAARRSKQLGRGK